MPRSIMVPCGKIISLATEIGGVEVLDNCGWLIGEPVLKKKIVLQKNSYQNIKARIHSILEL